MPSRNLACLAVAAFACGCAGPIGTGAVLPVKSGADVAVAAVAAPEIRQLEAGAMLEKPLDFDRGSAHYIGGVSSGLVAASPERILAALTDVDALGAMLPKTKRATLVDAHGAARRVELLQGTSWVNAKYTVELTTTPGSPDEVRFQMDRSRRHDINDVYGYFKVERFDAKHSLVTIAAAVDIGSGMTALLVGRRVQDVILSTPHVIRAYFARGGASGRPGLVARNDR